MRAIDANVLVRLLVRDDEQQAEAAETYVENGAWVSLLVLMETSWLIQSVYEVDKRRMRKLLDMLLQHQQLVIEAPDTVRSALSFYQSSTSLGFSDCLIAAAADKAGQMPLGPSTKSSRGSKV